MTLIGPKPDMPVVPEHPTPWFTGSYGDIFDDNGVEITVLESRELAAAVVDAVNEKYGNNPRPPGEPRVFYGTETSEIPMDVNRIRMANGKTAVRTYPDNVFFSYEDEDGDTEFGGVWDFFAHDEHPVTEIIES